MRAARVAMVGMLLGLGTAAGAPSDDVMLRLHEQVAAAEELERVARGGSDLAAYDACGEAYVAAAETSAIAVPEREAELRYNALACFDTAGSPERALAIAEGLIGAFPQAPVTPRAMVRAARLRERAGDVAGAAALLEDYSARFAGEAEAYDALAEAVRLRGALGDLAATTADVNAFVKRFGTRRRDAAADAMLFLARQTEVHGSPAEARAAYQRWQRTYSRSGTRLARGAALLASGELELARACPVPLTDGLCLRPAKAPRAVARCTAGITPRVAVPRDADAVHFAQVSLRVGAATVQTRPDIGGGWIRGRAALARASEATEQALVPPPAPALDGDGWSARSQTALATWLRQALDAHRRAERAAMDAIKIARDPRIHAEAMTLAATRLQVAIEQLDGAPLPAAVARHAEARAAYCGALTTVADELRAQLTAVIGACLSLDVVDERAACLRAADRLPAGAALVAPAARELVPAASWALSTGDVEPPAAAPPPAP